MRILALAAIIIGGPAAGEVVSASPNGFEVRHVVDASGTPDQAMARFGRVADWWNPEHSYSGKAASLSITLKAGGCFCEALQGGGGIEHMRVAYYEPGKRLTMTGGLGPLLYEATAGVMDLQFAPAGTGTKVTMTYRAAGFAKGGADKLAPIVDQVIGEQMRRYASTL